MLGDFLGNFEDDHFLCQTAVTNFWATFETNWVTF